MCGIGCDGRRRFAPRIEYSDPYLLPDIWEFALGALGVVWWDSHLSSGWPGVVKTGVFTGLMLALAVALTRARIRLQL